MWCMIPEMWKPEFFVILSHFSKFWFFGLLVGYTNNPKNQNFEKTETNHDHLCFTVPEIWCITDVIVIFHFWAIFCPFTPLTAQKIKIKKKETSGNILHKSTKNIMICYTVPEIWYVTDIIVIFHFGLFFAFLPPTPQKEGLWQCVN